MEKWGGFPSEIPALFEKTISCRLFFFNFLTHENETKYFVSVILLETFISSLKLTVSVNVWFLFLFCFVVFFLLCHDLQQCLLGRGAQKTCG